MALYEIDNDYLINMRRRLHAHPELSLHEQNTAALIRGELESFGISWQPVGDTGTYARIEGRAAGRRVLLRADIDALPICEETGLAFASQNFGVMHACGHDLHTASLLAAAKALVGSKEHWAGTVLLAFQQAEEFGHGSKFFIEQGLTRGYDRAFGLHTAPWLPAGQIALTRGADAASCDYFKIMLRGRPAHISLPHQGRDALAAAAELAVFLPGLTRFLNPLDNALIGVGNLHAGTAWNIVAQEAVIEGTLRVFSPGLQNLLQNRIREAAGSIAGLYGVNAEVEFENFTPAIINDDEAFAEARQAAEKLVGAENVITDSRRIKAFAADDFAEFIQQEKGVYIHIGTSNDNPDSRLSLHSSRLIFDERALPIAAEMYVLYALDVLNG